MSAPAALACPTDAHGLRHKLPACIWSMPAAPAARGRCVGTPVADARLPRLTHQREMHLAICIWPRPRHMAAAAMHTRGRPLRAARGHARSRRVTRLCGRRGACRRCPSPAAPLGYVSALPGARRLSQQCGGTPQAAPAATRRQRRGEPAGPGGRGKLLRPRGTARQSPAPHECSRMQTRAGAHALSATAACSCFCVAQAGAGGAVELRVPWSRTLTPRPLPHARARAACCPRH